MTQPQVVLVHWIDAWANGAGYYDSSYTYESLTMVDVGWVLEENERGILLGRTIQEAGDEPRYRGENFIPWEMVKKVEVLDYD